MGNNKVKKYSCPFCDQQCNRKFNMKVHLERRHNGLGAPVNNFACDVVGTDGFVQNTLYYTNRNRNYRQPTSVASDMNLKNSIFLHSNKNPTSIRSASSFQPDYVDIYNMSPKRPKAF